MLAGRTIHLCVTGGIAAYKAAETVRALQRAGAMVRVALSPNARQFIGALTFQALTHQRVLTETLDPSEEMEIGHIAFAQRCDALVVAPATADIIGKAAHGIGDEVVSTVLLATNVPVCFAPAMNTVMYENPFVQENLQRLVRRGWHMIEPTAGELACGAVGPGRMAEPESIAAFVGALFAPKLLTGRHIVVSAGPTREALDPVRFLSNPSTGKAGFAIARAAARAGARVTLVHGPVTLPVPAGVDAVPVTTALEMHAAMTAINDADAIVMSAAVADYRAADYTPRKVKKTAGPMALELVRNPDILAELGVARRGNWPVLVGFAAETGHPVPAAREKLVAKRVDLIVANDVTAPGAGFGGDDNTVFFVTREGTESLPTLSKVAVADRIVGWIATRLAATEGTA